MQVPSMLQGKSLKRLLQGAAAGAIATMFVGFYWGGWSLGSTARQDGKTALRAGSRSRPGSRVRRQVPRTAGRRGETSRAFEGQLWKRRDEFPKEFVTLPGKSYPSSALVDACYTLLLAPKSAALK